MRYMQTGDIIFYKSRGLISKLISMVIGSDYTHVSLALDEITIIEANRFITSHIVEFFPEEGEQYKVMRLKIPLTEAQKEHLKANAHKLEGRRYDWLGIFILFVQLVFKIKLSNIKNDTDELWCSELVDFMYEQLNIDLVPQISTNIVSPADIEHSPVLEEVIEGIS
jgi:hypothetical protein